MVDKPGTGEPDAAGTDRSIGALVSDATDNLSRLVRLEIQLAKLEAKADAARIGKGVAGFAVVAVLAHIFVILLSVTIAFALYELFALPAWACLGIVTLFYLLLAVAFGLYGLVNFRKRQGLQRTALTTSRLAGILRGEIRPPRTGDDLDTADTADTAGATAAPPR
ncbi:phage holin family protein [Nocardiopsis tropica]|jgi:uncharacterized membrane protein YqjE|uniref:Phage holin family protein n=1 Tax=Nocardiopsis tropica TaxID=109330 RepID=A0ABU7KNE7_9ACTN|nr:phage holin family protein [Nocardiopsis umidischolae]MEE2050810.1 phage holin family protein [Nocardiopsis umidischolae]